MNQQIFYLILKINKALHNQFEEPYKIKLILIILFRLIGNLASIPKLIYLKLGNFGVYLQT